MSSLTLFGRPVDSLSRRSFVGSLAGLLSASVAGLAGRIVRGDHGQSSALADAPWVADDPAVPAAELGGESGFPIADAKTARLIDAYWKSLRKLDRVRSRYERWNPRGLSRAERLAEAARWEARVERAADPHCRIRDRLIDRIIDVNDCHDVDRETHPSCGVVHEGCLYKLAGDLDDSPSLWAIDLETAEQLNDEV